jgi:hypothetical protein
MERMKSKEVDDVTEINLNRNLIYNQWHFLGL